MVFINHKGNKYGRDSFGSPSVRGRYRQAHHDFGSDINEHYVRVDNVASNVGACDNPCDIHRFRISSSKSQRKDYK
jgi:hypothetical protein